MRRSLYLVGFSFLLLSPLGVFQIACSNSPTAPLATPTPTTTNTITPTATFTNTPTPNATVCVSKSNFGDLISSSMGGLTPQMNYGIYTVPGTGNATLWDIQLYMSATATNPATIQCAVYQVGTGAQIGISAQQVVQTGGNPQWVVFNMTQPGTLLKGDPYYLCFWIVNDNNSMPATFSVDTVAATNYYEIMTFSGFGGAFAGGGTAYSGEPTLIADYCP